MIISNNLIKSNIELICKDKNLFNEASDYINKFINKFDFYNYCSIKENIVCFCVNKYSNNIIGCSFSNKILIYDFAENNNNLKLLESYYLNDKYNLRNVECMIAYQNNLVLGFIHGFILIVNILEKKIKKKITHHYDAILHLSYYNKTSFISCSMDQTIKIINLNGECLKTFIGHESYILSFDNIGNTLISGSIDSIIKIWNINEQSCFKTIYNNCDSVKSIIIIKNKIITKGWYNIINIYDFENYNKKKIYQDCDVLSIASLRNEYLVTLNKNKESKIYNLDGKCLKTIILNISDFGNISMKTFKDSILINNSNNYFGLINFN